LKKAKIKAGSCCKPHAVGYEFTGDDIISVMSLDSNSTLTVDIAKKDAKRVVKILKRGDVEFINFTGTIMLTLKKELKAEWIKALKNPLIVG